MSSTLDLIIVIAYLVAILGIGMAAGRKMNVEKFFVNERRTGTALLVFTVVATQVGAGALVGVASSTYANGSGFGLVAVASTLFGFLFVAYLAPRIKRFGDRFKAFTLSEFFRVRYGRSAQIASAFVILFTYLSFLAAQFVATGSLLSLWGGWAFQGALVFAAAGMIVYCAFAGLRGDIVTDAVHFWVMVVVLFLVLLPKVVAHTSASLLAQLPKELWSPITFGGYQFLIAGLVFGAVLAVVSMEMWIRVYAASGPKQARRTFVWSAFLVVPFYLAAMYFGYAARASLPALANPDMAIFELIFAYMPVGLLGLCTAAVLAVLISTANTMVLVVSATLKRDLLPSGKSPKQELRRGQIATFVVGAVGLGIALLSPHVVQLTLNAFYMLAVLFPALVGGFVWRRATKLAATLSIAAGAVFTLAFLPFMPTQAFIPGAIASVVSFVLVTLLTKHSASEKPTLIEEAGREEHAVN